MMKLRLFFILLLLPAAAFGQTVFPEVKIFIDVDQTLVSQVGGVANAEKFVQELVASTDAIFRGQLGLTLSLAGRHIFTDVDSFDRSSNNALLSSFANYAEASYREA